MSEHSNSTFPSLPGVTDWSLAVLLTASLVGAAEPPGREIILNTSTRPNNLDIYLFETPGSAPRRLTDDPALDYNPVFSPDGRWVVFCSERRGNPDLYALDLTREGPPRLLTDSPAMEDAPAFSPDGRTLAFVSTRDGRADICVMPFRPDGPDTSAQAANLTRHQRQALQQASASDGAETAYEVIQVPFGGNFNPTFSPDGRKIAFASACDGFPWILGGQNGASEIYVMDTDGSNLTRLTDAEGWDGSPAWSADGRTILFYSDRDGGIRLWRMNADGSDPSPFSPRDLLALSPALMRDGRVAFSARMDQRWRIISVASDGADLRLESDEERSYWAPAVDPHTGRLACHGRGPIEPGSTVGGTFPLMETGPWRIAGSPTQAPLPDRTLEHYVTRGFWSTPHPQGHVVASIDIQISERTLRLVTFRLDGTEIKELFRWNVSVTETPAEIRRRFDEIVAAPLNRDDAERAPVSRKMQRQFQQLWSPVWSPDGRWIAFTVGEPFGKPGAPCDIWKVQSDGNGAVNLTGDAKANDAFPSFSGDGRRIAFRSGRDGNHEIYVMDADGANLRRITDNPVRDTMPAFSPQGDWIAFSSNRDGDYELYIVPLDSSGAPGPERRLTHSPGRDVHPRFSPDGQWLVFASARGGLTDEVPLIRAMAWAPQPYGEIYALRLADGHVVRLTHNKWEDGIPMWGRTQD